MRFIPTRVHGMMDYLMAIILIASPWMFGFSEDSTAKWLFVVLGIGTILYSLMTDYELGISNTLSMQGHLTLDLLSGLLLAISPWIFDLSENAMVPAVVLGLVEIGASLMTQKTPHGRSDHKTSMEMHTSR